MLLKQETVSQISQLQDGKEQVISYASKTLNSGQRKYCTTRKELLSVVVFTRHYRHHLLCNHFVVRTDHASLAWLMRFKRPEGLLAWWLQELSNYDFDIVHQSGKKHSNADGLSRIVIDGECDCYIVGKDVTTLPCGGCEVCTKMQAQWRILRKMLMMLYRWLMGWLCQAKVLQQQVLGYRFLVRKRGVIAMVAGYWNPDPLRNRVTVR